MKRKIFLVGKMNPVTKNIRDALKDRFDILLTSENEDVIEGLLEVEHPDAILFCIIDVDKEADAIFQLLLKKEREMPIICLGEDRIIDAYADYIEKGKYQVLLRPITRLVIDKKLSDILNNSTGSVPNKSEKEIVRRRHILLIDDSPFHLRTMKKFLDDKYDVDMAKSVNIALDFIRKRIPDLIFLDYDMSDIDGKKAFQLLRKMDLPKEVPVIFLTGVNDKKRIQEVLNLKPKGYLLKPVSQEKILGVIEQTFSGAESMENGDDEMLW